jgi:hypothetical protein
MYTGIPIADSGADFFENLASIQNQITSFNDQNWIGLCCQKK